MPIAEEGYSGDKAIFFTQEYKTLVRSEKEILLRSATTLPIMNRNELYAYRTDVYRLLRSLGVQPHMYWTVAFLNGIENPDQDVSHLTFIYTLDDRILEKALSRSNTVQG